MKKVVLLALCGVVFGACAAPVGGPLDLGDSNADIAADAHNSNPTTGTMSDRLRQTSSLNLAASESFIDIVGIAYGDESTRTSVTIPAIDANLGLRYDGSLTVQNLILDLDDVTIHPGGVVLDLANIRVSVAEPTRLRSDEDPDVFHGTSDLNLDFSWIGDSGTPLPVATQTAQDVPLTVASRITDQGELELEMTGRLEGVVMEFGRLAEIHDLEFRFVFRQ